MTGWSPRRFWTTAQAVPVAGGFGVQLDTRPLRTPQQAPLTLPTLALATAIADEWQAQTATVAPDTMPLTRMANSAIDKVAPQRAEVAALLAAYGDSDLLCYRADGPADLIKRQAQAWDPLLAWAGATLSVPLGARVGVVHQPQDPASLAALADLVHQLDPFCLAAFHDLVTLSGSLVLALAVLRGRLAADDAWAVSRIDEDWQIAHWGHDEEAAVNAQRKRQAFLDADRFLKLCG